jgi:hypothetical protein
MKISYDTDQPPEKLREERIMRNHRKILDDVGFIGTLGVMDYAEAKRIAKERSAKTKNYYAVTKCEYRGISFYQVLFVWNKNPDVVFYCGKEI